MALLAITLAQVTAASGVELETWAKDVVALDKRLKTATDEFRGGLHDAGMVVYGIKRHHRSLQDQKHVGSTSPWSTTWKRMTGTEKPSPRATTMAVAIEAYVVESGYLTEAELRACPVDSAEVAVGIYRDCGETFTHEAVVKAAELLKVYTAAVDDKTRKGVIKRLRELRRSLKTPEPMSSEQAFEAVRNILAADPTFATIVATELVAHLRYEKTPEILHGVWAQMKLADDCWPPELVDEWIAATETCKPSAPTRSEAPAPAAPAPTPAPALEPVTPDFAAWVAAQYPANPEVHADFTKALAKYHSLVGHMPDDASAFEAWLEPATEKVAA